MNRRVCFTSRIMLPFRSLSSVSGITGHSHTVSPSSIPFGPTLGLAQARNSSRPQRTRSTCRNRQPLRRRFIEYHERGGGKQEEMSRGGEIQIPSTKFQTNSTLQIANGPSGGRQRFGHLGLVLGICLGFGISDLVLFMGRIPVLRRAGTLALRGEALTGTLRT